MARYYRRDGTAFEGGIIEWAKEFEKEDRIVKKDKVNGRKRKEYLVSTVFLGIDHAFTESEPPLIFETMVFPSGSWMDVFCARYSNEAAARLGHEETVGLVRSGKIGGRS